MQRINALRFVTELKNWVYFLLVQVVLNTNSQGICTDDLQPSLMIATIVNDLDKWDQHTIVSTEESWLVNYSKLEQRQTLLK